MGPCVFSMGTEVHSRLLLRRSAASMGPCVVGTGDAAVPFGAKWIFQFQWSRALSARRMRASDGSSSISLGSFSGAVLRQHGGRSQADVLRVTDRLQWGRADSAQGTFQRRGIRDPFAALMEPCLVSTGDTCGPERIRTPACFNGAALCKYGRRKGPINVQSSSQSSIGPC